MPNHLKHPIIHTRLDTIYLYIYVYIKRERDYAYANIFTVSNLYIQPGDAATPHYETLDTSTQHITGDSTLTCTQHFGTRTLIIIERHGSPTSLTTLIT